MDPQGVLNTIFGILMVLVIIACSAFIIIKVCCEEWEFGIGAIVGAIMLASIYGTYVLDNLPK